jgi:hypothetical protein
MTALNTAVPQATGGMGGGGKTVTPIIQESPKDIRAIFIQTYFVERHENSHTVFAERTGLPRAEAKMRAYTEAYSTPIVRDISLAAYGVI